MRTALSRSRIRLAGLFVALLVLAGAVAALASGAPTAAHQARPALTLTHRSPATVRGTGFKPNTHVRVVLRASHTVVHRPVTNAQGTFTTTFSMVIDRCSSWSISVTQPGRLPMVLHGAKPQCPPA